MKDRDVEISLLKDIIKSSKSVQRVKEQEIKKLQTQIHKLMIKTKEKKKSFDIQEKSSLNVLNEFDIEESINNVILENKQFYQKEVEEKEKKANSFSLENYPIDINDGVQEKQTNMSYIKNYEEDASFLKVFSNKLPVVRNASSKVLPNDIFHNMSQEEISSDGGSKNFVRF